MTKIDCWSSRNVKYTNTLYFSSDKGLRIQNKQLKEITCLEIDIVDPLQSYNPSLRQTPLVAENNKFPGEYDRVRPYSIDVHVRANQ